jgi:AraC-like DNA-binding protein
MLKLDAERYILKPHFATIHCEPGWRWRKRPHPMPNYDIFYVWQGQGDLTLNGKHYPLVPHTCFLFRPGDSISATHQPQDPLMITYIHFDLAGPVTLIPRPYRIIHDYIPFEALLSRYVRLFLVDTFGAELEAKLILKQLMIHLLRAERESAEMPPGTARRNSNALIEAIEEAAHYVQEHPAEPHSVHSLAARANLSPKYFSQKFKEIIGQSVRSYIVHARIKRAEHLLYHAGMTVTETADALGYNDIHFFSRQFKKYTGRNPSEVR